MPAEILVGIFPVRDRRFANSGVSLNCPLTNSENRKRAGFIIIKTNLLFRIENKYKHYEPKIPNKKIDSVKYFSFQSGLILQSFRFRRIEVRRERIFLR